MRSGWVAGHFAVMGNAERSVTATSLIGVAKGYHMVISERAVGALTRSAHVFRFDPYAPEVDADPFPLYRILRDEHPCFWSEEARMWMLTRHADISAALANWRTFSSASGNLMDEPPNT